jgi:hypothetical protein
MKARHVAFGVVGLVLAACSVSVTVGGPPENYYWAEPGQVIFGTDLDSSFQFVKDKLTTIRDAEKVSFLGGFDQFVTGRVQLTMSKDGAPPASTGGIDCQNPCNYVSGKYNLVDLPGPGDYLVTMYGPNGEKLASGAFTVAE